MDPVIPYYNDYNEEERLDNKANKVEFITKIKVLDEIIKPNSKILDVAVVTGTYAFYYAENGYQLTAAENI